LVLERKGNLQLFKMIEVLRRLSKIIMVRSALAVALAKSGGRVDILHNLHYNYGFGVVVADVGSIIMPIM
jgi:hypothetical protein